MRNELKLKIMSKKIEIFKSIRSYGNIVERRANDWIKTNNINVIDIRTSYSFWDGYKCEVIYEYSLV